MNEMLILGGIGLALWALLVWLRLPSSIAFLSLLIGQLLSSEASDDVFDFVATIFKVQKVEYVEAFLLILPLVLTMAILRNHVVKAKMFVEALPLLFITALTVLLLAPLIPPLETLLDNATNNQASAYKSIIVVAASVSGLLSAWFSYPKPHTKDHHGKGKH